MVLEGAVAVGRVKCQQKPDDAHNEQGNVFLMNLFYKRKRSVFQFISFPPFPLPAHPEILGYSTEVNLGYFPGGQNVLLPSVACLFVP